MKNFDEKQLKECFGLYATGVMIAATFFEEKLHGLTINSFASVSLNPALALFSISNNSQNLEIFKNTKNYCFNILSQEQLVLAKEFAKPQNPDKWLLESYKMTEKNNPIFQNSLGFIECENFNFFESGDHHIFIGKIIACQKINSNKALIYHSSKFINS